MTEHPRPSFMDWLMLIFNIVFSVIGLGILWNGDRNVGVVTLALFGSCLLHSVSVIWQKLRDRAFFATHVEVRGGVPIHKRLLSFVGMSAWLLALGATLALFGVDYGAVFRWTSGLIAALGGGGLIAWALGYTPSGYLQFDPEGLTFSEFKWRVTVPWDAIAGVHEKEYVSNPLLLLTLADDADIVVSPQEHQPAAIKRMARYLSWYGAPIAIMPIQYGINIPMLAAAISTYREDYAARERLKPQVALES